MNLVTNPPGIYLNFPGISEMFSLAILLTFGQEQKARNLHISDTE